MAGFPTNPAYDILMLHLRKKQIQKKTNVCKKCIRMNNGRGNENGCNFFHASKSTL